uniref:Uncharacterized protein n=1 Tax=Panagrolaimus sp. ES5 TaxID=591445 RepID=A0AC34GDJ4_9BILA
MTVVFHSGKSDSPFLDGLPRWLIQTSAIPSPITNKTQLNSATMPTLALRLDDMVADQAFTVCSPENDLELFIAEGFSMTVFDLYDSYGLTDFVDT